VVLYVDGCAPTVHANGIAERLDVLRVLRDVVKDQDGEAFRDEVKVAWTGTLDILGRGEGLEAGLLGRGEGGELGKGRDKVWHTGRRGLGGIDIVDRVSSPDVG
jgi:hypothetical protein